MYCTWRINELMKSENETYGKLMKMKIRKKMKMKRMMKKINKLGQMKWIYLMIKCYPRIRC